METIITGYPEKSKPNRPAAKALFLLIITGAAILAAGCSQSGRLTLSRDGKALYTIVLPDRPTAVEATAAGELKKYLDEITGAAFAIVNETDAGNARPRIAVGNSRLAEALLPGVDAAKLPYDGIVIETAGENILLLGHPVRGTLYAVHTFLEDAAGVRWWTSTESSVPENKNLTVPKLHVRYAPPLVYREALYKDAYHDEMFTSRMKCNGHFAGISPRYGGHHQFRHFVHSFYPILPPETYFDSHPEWYSLVDGRRTFRDYAQLCLSSEEMQRQFIANVLDMLHENPDAGFISVSQNDCDDRSGGCRCGECQAIVREEGSEAGPLIRFVNRVAEAVERDFPDVWVETLAYRYTRKAPLKVRPRHNVVVRLCTIECSFAQPLDGGEQNRPFREDLEAWSRIANHLFIWNYVTGFTSYLLPHPNIHTLAGDIRFFVRNRAIGLFEQGDALCDAGDFVRMRNWVISHLMWNPEADENRLIDRFLTGYYGEKAAPFLRKYWDLLTAAGRESGVYLSCYMHDTAGWLSVPAYAEAARLMRQALDVTEDETLRNRLRREAIPLKYVLLLENERFKTYEKETGSLPLTLPEPEQALDELMALLREFNVTTYREAGSPLSELEQTLRGKLFPGQQ